MCDQTVVRLLYARNRCQWLHCESTRGLHEFLRDPAAFVIRCVIVIRMWLTCAADATRCCLQRFVKDEWDRMVLHLQPRDRDAVLTVQHHRIVSAWCRLQYPQHLKYHLPVWWTDFVAIGCLIMVHLAPGRPFCSSSCPPRVYFSHARSVLSLWTFFPKRKNQFLNAISRTDD